MTIANQTVGWISNVHPPLTRDMVDALSLIHPTQITLANTVGRVSDSVTRRFFGLSQHVGLRLRLTRPTETDSELQKNAVIRHFRITAADSKELLTQLATQLTQEFDASNLRYMRLFFQASQKCDALRHELSGTYCSQLLRIDYRGHHEQQ